MLCASAQVSVPRASNEASGINGATTLVDDAELVWALAQPVVEIGY